MTKISTKKALMLSLLSMLICVSMLVGSTFAWFTDTATVAVNSIQSGTLDVELQMATEWDESTGDPKTWENAEGKELSFRKATGATETEVLWEPGCTYALPELKVVNKGNLALKYKILITGIKGSAELNEVIDWTISGDELGKEYTLMANAESSVLKISGHMQETAGNDYQNKTIDGIAITVVATQYNYEYDSTDNTYDKDAVLPVASTAKGNLNLTSTSTAQSAETTGSQELGDSVMTVTYPAGVKISTTTVSSGTDDTKKTTVEQKLEYVDDKASDAMSAVSITADKAVASYTLTLPVDTTNTTLVTVTINYTPGLSGVQIYHSGKLLAGSAAAEGENAQEYAEYNSTSGVIKLHLFHASPIDIIYDKPGIATVTTAAELEAAFANTDISTIVLGDSFSLSKVLDVTHDVTVDFNGKTLTANDTWVTSAQRAIDVNACKLIFKDSADEKGKFVSSYGGVKLWGETPAFELNDITIECSKIYAVRAEYNANGATAVMNSGKIIGNAFSFNDVASDSNATVTINGGTIDATNADAYTSIYAGDCYTLTINGGEFIGDGQPSIIKIGSYNPYDGKWTVNVTGGTFTNNGSWPYAGFGGIISAGTKDALSITGGTFNVDPSDYVASGYEAVKNDTAGTWTVSATK